MEDFNFETTAIVQPISPLHIGTGDKLTPISYVFRQGKISVLDEITLLNWVGENPSRSSLFINAIENRKSIGDFLREMNTPYDPFVLYSLKAEINHPPKEILPFIKTIDSYPYLPGSSVKGCLRSALLRGAVLADPDLANDFSDQVIDAADQSSGRHKNTGSEALEARIFVKETLKDRKKYSNYDLNRALIISDSQPVRIETLEVIEAHILSVRSGGRLEDKKMGIDPVMIHVETAKPGTNFRLILRRDLRWLKGDGPASELGLDQPSRSRFMLYLSDYCRAVGFELINQEIGFYRRHGHHDLAGWFEGKRDLLKNQEGLFILPMGWGSGYDAKTVTDLLSEETFETVVENFENTKGLGRPGNVPGNPWLGPAESPKSRKIVIRPNGNIEPIGWVVMKLEADGESPDDWDNLLKKVSPPDFSIDEEAKEINLLDSIQAENDLNDTEVNQETMPFDPNQITDYEPQKPVKPDVFVLTFLELPEPSDCFKGVVLFVDEGKTFIEIPGLSPDEKAMAWIANKDFPARSPFPEEGSILACEVIDVNLDPHQRNFWLVHCKPY